MLPMKIKLAVVLIVSLISIISNSSYSQTNKSFSVQGYYGSVVPFSSKTDFLTTDFTWGIEANYKISGSTFATLTFSVNDFESNPPLPIEFYNDYTRAYNYSAGFKQYFTVSDNIFPYGKIQAGLYNVREFDTEIYPHEISYNSFGINSGGGVLYKYDQSVGAFAEAVFHNVFTDDNFNFMTIQGGIKFDF